MQSIFCRMFTESLNPPSKKGTDYKSGHIKQRAVCFLNSFQFCSKGEKRVKRLKNLPRLSKPWVSS